MKEKNNSLLWVNIAERGWERQCTRQDTARRHKYNKHSSVGSNGRCVGWVLGTRLARMSVARPSVCTCIGMVHIQFMQRAYSSPSLSPCGSSVVISCVFVHATNLNLENWQRTTPYKLIRHSVASIPKWVISGEDEWCRNRPDKWAQQPAIHIRGNGDKSSLDPRLMDLIPADGLCRI